MKNVILLTLFLPLFSIIAETTSPGDYGIVAHLSRGTEYPTHLRELDMLKELGVSFVRFDFDWRTIEPRRGEFHFEKFDELVNAAAARGIFVLPILGGFVDSKRISAPYKHMGEFLDYVRACVTRYKGRIHAWEIMNEVNVARFWGDTPDAAKYTVFLAETNKLIKEIDPSAKVLYSGLSHTPVDFIELSLQNGAAAHFDGMNVHPYSLQELPELNLPPRLDALSKLLKKYNVDQRELWVTESGNATGSNQIEPFYRIAEKGIELCKIVPEKTELVVFSDDKYCYYSTEEAPLLQKKFKSVKVIRLEELDQLDPVEHPLILFAPVEYFPCGLLGKVRAYVQKGGTILLHGGLPFYYDLVQEGTALRRVQVNDKYLKELRIGWGAWWKDQSLPKRFSSIVCPENGTVYAISSFGQCLSTKNLGKEDKLIPLAFAVENDRYYPCAGVFQFGGDLKGNAIMCTSRELSKSENCTEETQAKLLARNALIMKGHGVDKYFIYCFVSTEKGSDREHHFGLVHRDLTPKMAFYAYQTLIKMCPDGSSKVKLKQDGKVFSASWQTPQKEFRHAIWTYSRNPIPAQLQNHGRITGAFDHLGKAVMLDPAKTTISDGALFITGPEKLEVHVQEGTSGNANAADSAMK